MFIAALSTIAKLWKEPKGPLNDEWIKKMWCTHTQTQTHTHTQWNTTQPSKKCNLAICNDVDRARGYYAKRNKSIRKRQLYDLTHMWNLRNKREDHRGMEGKIK